VRTWHKHFRLLYKHLRNQSHPRYMWHSLHACVHAIVHWFVCISAAELFEIGR